jgi:transposase InsO family protein
MAESFFTSLECELINRRSWQTKSQARLAVFTWIESWYNPMRRHSGINFKAPNNFEKALNDEEIESNQQTPKGFTQEAQTVR